MSRFPLDEHEPLPIGPQVEEDLFTWLSDQWWTPWVMFGVSIVVGLWMIRSLVLHRGRAHQIERAAASAGMQYREQDGFGLSKLGFHHMARGDGKGWSASHVVTMDHGGRRKTHAFDVRSWVEYTVTEDRQGQQVVRRGTSKDSPASAKVVRKFTGGTSTAALAKLPINAPRLVIARENLASKLFSAATRLDLDVESEAFNRWYHVIGSDRAFAREILDARMIDFMTQTEGKISFEFHGNWLLLHTVQLEPELMPGLARLAEQMSRVVPQLVIDRWPSAARATGVG